MDPEAEVLGDDAVRFVRRPKSDPQTDPAREIKPVRPLPRWLFVVVALLVIAGGVAWYVDHRIAKREAAAIAGCHGALETASSVYDLRMESTYSYLRPGLTGSSHRQAQLLSLMAFPAQQSLPSARASLARCEGVHVVSWHATNLARLKADTTYATTLVGQLEAIAHKRLTFDVENARLAGLRSAAGI